MRDEPTRIVAAGYDQISYRYMRWAAQIEGDPRDRMLEAFIHRLRPGARVLDLGCGAGIPSTKALATEFDVVGVDASKAQIALARANVPTAEFILGDIATIDFADASFDGVTALYSISHIPREEHPWLFARIARWLVPGGIFLATLGVTDEPR
jgi:ubiquinone/menaquinone biosynthesis C-methylase UbiE